MSAVGIIPARYASTRFPGKPLADIAGRPMIRHVYERACRATTLEEVLVATDDQRIFDAVVAFGGEVIMTSAYHPTGTDRIAEVAERLSAAHLLVNIQGDEPLIDPETIDAVVTALQQDQGASICSVMAPFASVDDIRDTNQVKVAVDVNGYAMFFSRSPIPAIPNGYTGGAGGWKRHVGLYAYRRDFLLAFSRLPCTPLEKMEKLEQLRALENSYRIKMIERAGDDICGVDTPEDLQRILSRFEAQPADTNA